MAESPRRPPPASDSVAITLPKLLVVEGKDACLFFGAALQHLGLADSIGIHNAGGHSQWGPKIRALSIAAGFDAVTSLGLVRDAETDARNAFRSVCTHLRLAGLPVPRTLSTPTPGPPRVSVFILPDGTQSGMLETLCMQSVLDKPATACVDEYFACLKARNVPQSREEAKACVHAYLASQPRPDLRLGEAAGAGYWPWDSAALADLLTFLRSI